MQTSETILEAELRRFLEDDPLYHPVTISGGFCDTYVWPRKITFLCARCKGDRTFAAKREYSVENGTTRLEFECSECEATNVVFYVHGYLQDNEASVAYVKKIGQVPPWRIEPQREIAKFLGPDGADFYKKALVCLSQSYGLGAIAYIRRVVEDMARDLLHLIEQLRIQEGATEEDLVPLRQAASSKDADRLMKAAAEMLPEYLRPGGENPLDVIHSATSGALHRGTEKECVQRALEAVKAIEYVVPSLSRHIDSRRDYSEAMKRLRGP